MIYPVILCACQKEIHKKTSADSQKQGCDKIYREKTIQKTKANKRKRSRKKQKAKKEKTEQIEKEKTIMKKIVKAIRFIANRYEETYKAVYQSFHGVSLASVITAMEYSNVRYGVCM